MECGADDIILVTKDMTPQQIAKMAEEKLGCMPDITIECTGAEPCIQVSFCMQGVQYKTIFRLESMQQNQVDVSYWLVLEKKWLICQLSTQLFVRLIFVVYSDTATLGPLLST